MKIYEGLKRERRLVKRVGSTRVALSFLFVAIVSAFSGWYVARTVTHRVLHQLCAAVYAIDTRQIAGTRYQIKTAQAFADSKSPSAVRAIYRRQLPARRAALAKATSDRDDLSCAEGMK